MCFWQNRFPTHSPWTYEDVSPFPRINHFASCPYLSHPLSKAISMTAHSRFTAMEQSRLGFSSLLVLMDLPSATPLTFDGGVIFVVVTSSASTRPLSSPQSRNCFWKLSSLLRQQQSNCLAASKHKQYDVSNLSDNWYSGFYQIVRTMNGPAFHPCFGFILLNWPLIYWLNPICCILQVVLQLILHNSSLHLIFSFFQIRVLEPALKNVK
mgnify:CR=1 FL=1